VKRGNRMNGEEGEVHEEEDERQKRKSVKNLLETCILVSLEASTRNPKP
jgi:hypothetical protein